jgi:lipid II:glycine glycyltransferase (peptidoglycan interpeptide bridge formation enzyme)
MDIRQSPEYGHYLAQIGWVVEQVSGVNYFIRKFPLVGSIIKIQRPEKIDFEEIEKLTKKYKAFQIILEPITTRPRSHNLSPSIGSSSSIHNSLYAHKFKLSKSPYLPTKTLLIDIGLTNFRSDIKRAINKFNNDQFSIYTNNLDQFRNAWKKAVGLSKYVPSLKQLQALQNSFKINSLFVTTSDKSAGIIFLVSGTTLYYWQAFSDKKKRYLPNQYRMVWYGILWGKKRGAKLFDFEGIYDERFPNKSWLGFTHFKKTFGGKEVEYPGCFIKTKTIFSFP